MRSKASERHGIPVAETQAGKSSLPDQHPLNMGAIGVTGTSAANALAEEADLVLAVGTRLQDFTTGSWALFKNPTRRIVTLNVQGFDAGKHGAMPLIADARVGLEVLGQALHGYAAPSTWTEASAKHKSSWAKAAAKALAAPAGNVLASDAQVVGAVMRSLGANASVVCAAGGLPGELHKLWQAGTPGRRCSW